MKRINADIRHPLAGKIEQIWHYQIRVCDTKYDGFIFTTMWFTNQVMPYDIVIPGRFFKLDDL